MIRTILRITLFLAGAELADAQQLAFRQIASGLDLPVAITHAGDSRLFITLERGRVVIFDGTRILPTPFLDITPLVSCCGERGLLSVAFHPRYRENRFFYVDYTDLAGNTVIARYRGLSNDPDRADPTSALVLLHIDQPFANHNGGGLQFGPDGYLYIGMGDGGSAGDPGNRAQDLSTLLGKLLRIDVDGGSPYAVPPSNPFMSRSGARPEIWAYGLRNPWRFTFDRQTNELFIGDVGQNLWEEIDLQPATSIGGENYGWRKMEGNHCFNPPTNCSDPSLVLPVIEYGHSGSGCTGSVTGGYVYRGSQFPRFLGNYFYGDYCNGMIWSASRQPNGAWLSRLLVDTNFAISTFGEDFNGEQYVADHARGVIYQLIDTTPVPARRRAVR